MKTSLWVLIVVVVATVGFLSGYSISAGTGVIPGYFDAVEAAGYGGGGDEKVEGLSEDMEEYYKSLTADEEEE